jgi:hypothetical protein
MAVPGVLGGVRRHINKERGDDEACDVKFELWPVQSLVSTSAPCLPATSSFADSSSSATFPPHPSSLASKKALDQS